MSEAYVKSLNAIASDKKLKNWARFMHLHAWFRYCCRLNNHGKQVLFHPPPHLQAKLESKWWNTSADGLQSLVEKISTPSPLMLGRWLCTMHPRRDSIKALGPFIPLYWVAFLFQMCVDFSAKKPRVCQTTHFIIIFFGSQCVKKSLIHMRMYLATD